MSKSLKLARLSPKREVMKWGWCEDWDLRYVHLFSSISDPQGEIHTQHPCIFDIGGAGMGKRIEI